MMLDGDRPALAAYLSGERASFMVAKYFKRAGLALMAGAVTGLQPAI
jgi:hypothetical protein